MGGTEAEVGFGPSSHPTAIERTIPNSSGQGGNTLNGKENAVRNDKWAIAPNVSVLLMQ
jgi:hypothetical protein